MRQIKYSLLILILFTGCSPISVKIINSEQLEKITSNHFLNWTLEECNYIISSQTSSNINHFPSYEMALNLSKDQVFISAVPMNKTTILAMTRKTAIERRLTDEEHKDLLELNLFEYAGLRLDENSKIIKSDLPADSLSFSFKITFENVSNPYHPIILEDGYSYFFLENADGDFTRVKEVSGLFAEEDFILNDYLSVIVTFYLTDDKNNTLFIADTENHNYNLVFNGLQQKPIIIKWET